jgi:UDP-hydrolysing UDP-N-acetyl-D-glucosamine 2-epimerase
MKEVVQHPKLTLQVVTTASAILDRFGNADEIIQGDGFEVETRLFSLVEGSSPETMAKSTGLGLIDMATTFARLKPDVVITIGDRFETMATAIAASYMNIPLAHTMGGEVSGSIDDSVRHAVTKLAHLHFVSTPLSRERVISLGEDPSKVHYVGCPRIDFAKDALENVSCEEVSLYLKKEGVGDQIDLTKPFLLVSQHSVTTEFNLAQSQMKSTLDAVQATAMPSVVLWPNADAGSDEISASIRQWRESCSAQQVRAVKNMPGEFYFKAMSLTSCLVGNSSSGIREGAFIGTPVVNIGTRQCSREKASNVVDVPHERDAIHKAIKRQISHGSFPSSNLYGHGLAGKQIAEILAECDLSVTKRTLGTSSSL